MKKIVLVLLLSLSQTFAFSQYVNKALWVGETYQCDATGAVMGNMTDLTWSSTGGVSLSGSGLYRNVTATKYFSGTATVSCSWKYTLYYGDTQKTGGRSWTFTCIENPVSIFPAYLDLAVGDSYQLSYAHQFNNTYTNSASVYFSASSSSAGIISVSDNGLVTAKQVGIAYVNVHSNLSNASNAPYCTIRVTEKPVDPVSLELKPQSFFINVGDTYQLKYYLSPDNAKRELSWKSTSPTVASVSSSGLVQGKGVGKATITAETPNGLVASVAVSVAPKITSISLSDIEINAGYSATLTPLVSPSDAWEPLIWESSSPGIASVDEYGVVKAKIEGVTTITVKTHDGKTASCRVSVNPLAPNLSARNSTRRIEVIREMISNTINQSE